MQGEVGQCIAAFTEHKGLQNEQQNRHHNTDNKEQNEYDRNNGLMHTQTDFGRASAFAADGCVGFTRTDQLLVHKDRNRCDTNEDKCHCKRGFSVL